MEKSLSDNPFAEPASEFGSPTEAQPPAAMPTTHDDDGDEGDDETNYETGMEAHVEGEEVKEAADGAGDAQEDDTIDDNNINNDEFQNDDNDGGGVSPDNNDAPMAESSGHDEESSAAATAAAPLPLEERLEKDLQIRQLSSLLEGVQAQNKRLEAELLAMSTQLQKAENGTIPALQAEITLLKEKVSVLVAGGSGGGSAGAVVAPSSSSEQQSSKKGSHGESYFGYPSALEALPALELAVQLESAQRSALESSSSALMLQALVERWQEEAAHYHDMYHHVCSAHYKPMVSFIAAPSSAAQQDGSENVDAAPPVHAYIRQVLRHFPQLVEQQMNTVNTNNKVKGEPDSLACGTDGSSIGSIPWRLLALVMDYVVSCGYELETELLRARIRDVRWKEQASKKAAVTVADHSCGKIIERPAIGEKRPREPSDADHRDSTTSATRVTRPVSTPAAASATESNASASSRSVDLLSADQRTQALLSMMLAFLEKAPNSNSTASQPASADKPAAVVLGGKAQVSAFAGAASAAGGKSALSGGVASSSSSVDPASHLRSLLQSYLPSMATVQALDGYKAKIRAHEKTIADLRRQLTLASATPAGSSLFYGPDDAVLMRLPTSSPLSSTATSIDASLSSENVPQRNALQTMRACAKVFAQRCWDMQTLLLHNTTHAIEGQALISSGGGLCVLTAEAREAAQEARIAALETTVGALLQQMQLGASILSTVASSASRGGVSGGKVDHLPVADDDEPADGVASNETEMTTARAAEGVAEATTAIVSAFDQSRETYAVATANMLTSLERFVTDAIQPKLEAMAAGHLRQLAVLKEHLLAADRFLCTYVLGQDIGAAGAGGSGGAVVGAPQLPLSLQELEAALSAAVATCEPGKRVASAITAAATPTAKKEAPRPLVPSAKVGPAGPAAPPLSPQQIRAQITAAVKPLMEAKTRLEADMAWLLRYVVESEHIHATKGVAMNPVAELAAAKREGSALQQKQKQAEQQLKSVQDAQRASEQKAQAALRQLEQKQQMLSESQGRLAKLSTEAAEKDKLQGTLQGRVQSLEQLQATAADTVKQLQARCAAADAEKKDLQKALATAEKRVSELATQKTTTSSADDDSAVTMTAAKKDTNAAKGSDVAKEESKRPITFVEVYCDDEDIAAQTLLPTLATEETSDKDNNDDDDNNQTEGTAGGGEGQKIRFRFAEEDEEQNESDEGAADDEEAAGEEDPTPNDAEEDDDADDGNPNDDEADGNDENAAEASEDQRSQSSEPLYDTVSFVPADAPDENDDSQQDEEDNAADDEEDAASERGLADDDAFA